MKSEAEATSLQAEPLVALLAPCSGAGPNLVTLCYRLPRIPYSPPVTPALITNDNSLLSPKRARLWNSVDTGPLLTLLKIPDYKLPLTPSHPTSGLKDEKLKDGDVE